MVHSVKIVASDYPIPDPQDPNAPIFLAHSGFDNSGEIINLYDNYADTSISNSGTITGSVSGVAGVTFDNTGDGSIDGGVGAGTVTNDGDITGSVSATGSLTNFGSIGGAANGVSLNNYGTIDGAANGTAVYNAGTISGNADSLSSLDNTSLISGRASSRGSLTNSGTIEGGAYLGPGGPGTNTGLNTTVGDISGGVGIRALIGYAAFTNDGTIDGPVSLLSAIDTANAGATLDNAGGIITGDTVDGAGGATYGSGAVYAGVNTVVKTSGSIAGGDGSEAGGLGVSIAGTLILDPSGAPSGHLATGAGITGGSSTDGIGGPGLVMYSGNLQESSTTTVDISGGAGVSGGVGLILKAATQTLTLPGNIVVTGGPGSTSQSEAIGTPIGVNWPGLGPNSGNYVGTGGSGAVVAAYSTLANYAPITAGAGADSSAAAEAGGRGGIGIVISGAVQNIAGTITGGAGGDGASGFAAGYGGAGALMFGGILGNYSTIQGGDSQGHGIDSHGGAGIYVVAPLTGTTEAVIRNHVGGSITGGSTAFGQGGEGVSLIAGKLLNKGTIKGGYSLTGANLDKNPADGIFAQGGDGVDARGGMIGSRYQQAYVDNTGTIMGGGSGAGYGGNAVYLSGGTQFNNHGLVVGGAGVNGGDGLDVTQTALYTAANYSDGTISGGAASGGTGGLGAWLATPGSTLDSGGTVLGGNSSAGGAGGAGVAVLKGAVLNNYGSITGGSGVDSSSRKFDPTVGVFINGGTVNDAGSITGGTQTLGATVYHGDSILFGPLTGGTLVLTTFQGHDWQLNGAVSGFQAGDSIDILNLTPAQVAAGFNATTDTLTTPDDGTLVLGGDLSGESFNLTAINGGTGTEITVAACYLRGTRIRAERGEIPIEALRIGDRVLTRSGAWRPIRWIGRRSYSAAQAADQREVQPVLIKACALGHDLPERDLWVSPEHAMYLAGVLVPARALVNGSSIVRDASVADITYFHLELDDHDVIFAEGAAAESFVDDESRLRFDNVAEYFARYPHERPRPARFCAPRIEDGAELEQVRGRLRAIAARATGPSVCQPGVTPYSGEAIRAS